MTMVSSLTTYSSLAMAQMETPVPAERMAVLETSEFPGSESTIDCAFLLGSSEGTFEARRAGLMAMEAVGRVRGMREGRRERAPVGRVSILSTL